MTVHPISSFWNLVGEASRHVSGLYAAHEGLQNPELLAQGYALRRVAPIVPTFSASLRGAAFGCAFIRLMMEAGLSLDEMEEAAEVFKKQAEGLYPSSATSHPGGELQRNLLHLALLLSNTLKVAAVFLRFSHLFQASEDEIDLFFINSNEILKKGGDIERYFPVLEKFHHWFAYRGIPHIGEMTAKLKEIRDLGKGFFPLVTPEEPLYTNPPLSRKPKELNLPFAPLKDKGT